MGSPAPGLRCRQIDKADIGAVASLLARGFPARNLRFWREAMAQLTQHEPPPGLPQYGYLLESGGVIVGAILLICSALPGDGDAIRCNLSSWYVDPAFRAYAPMLVAQALRRKDITYLNVSPAPHTLPIIEAMGFTRYCDGIFVAIPARCGLLGGEKVATRTPSVNFDPHDRDTLLRHAALGCVSLWCATPERALRRISARLRGSWALWTPCCRHRPRVPRTASAQTGIDKPASDQTAARRRSDQWPSLLRKRSSAAAAVRSPAKS